MKWPWEKRAEEAESQATQAEEHFEHVEEHWDMTRKLAADSKIQREMNGWTAKVLDIFAG